MKKSTSLLLSGIAVIALGVGMAYSHSAQAQSAADLGKTLTPTGAEAAASADGQIPAWTGGITTPPAGYSVGMHHPDPYAADAPLMTITNANAAQFAAYLTEGHKAMLAKYPDYKMVVYPSHRSFSAPQRIYDATIANASRASLGNDGNAVVGAKEGIPFPVPQNGQQAIWNHLLRWRGDSVSRNPGQANPQADGSYTMVKIHEDAMFPYNQAGGTDGNISVYFLQKVMAPARLAGEMLLVHETIDQITQKRNAWTYNPGQRRVRAAPNVAYDNPGTASDGMRTSDNLDMFNGAIDRYDWTLVGKKEMLVPYNSYKLHAQGIPYDTLIKAGHINQDYARYEMHRVYVVDAKLKPGASHIYARRTFYLDEDSWSVLAVDHYDAQGNLWRVGESHTINYYEVPAIWSTLDCNYDLSNTRYTCFGFDNNEPMYSFNTGFTASDFTPDKLRNEGVR